MTFQNKTTEVSAKDLKKLFNLEKYRKSICTFPNKQVEIIAPSCLAYGEVRKASFSSSFLLYPVVTIPGSVFAFATEPFSFLFKINERDRREQGSARYVLINGATSGFCSRRACASSSCITQGRHWL